MNHAVPPTGAELTTFLKGEGFTVPVEIDMDEQASLAYDWFCSQTGFTPWIAAAAVHYYDPPGITGSLAQPRGGERKLRLDNGIVVLRSVTIGGVAKIEGTDFLLKPYNRTPKFLMEFFVPLFGPAKSISIDADWGRAAELPGGAFQLILYYGANLVLTELLYRLTNGLLKSDKVGDVEQQWDPELIKLFLDGAKGRFTDAALAPYSRKPWMGL